MPDDSANDILLTLERMDRVRSIEPSTFTMTVEAGCILRKVQEATRAADRLFP